MSFKNKREGIPMFLAGFACAAMLAALLATIPESRAATDCGNTPLPVQSSSTIQGLPGSSNIYGYSVTYSIPDCLKEQGFKIINLTKSTNQTIKIDYGS